MSREIKFRAWLKEEERMVSVSDISFIGQEIDKYEGDSSSGDWWGFDYIELMQYTGLKDKNGNEIYEGDICKHHGHDVIGKWIYDDGFTSFVMMEGENHYFYFGIDEDRLEVIGNIYENPELLS